MRAAVGGDKVNRAGGMRNVTALGLVIFFTGFSTEIPFFVHKITI